MFSFNIKLIHYFRMAIFITIIFLVLPRLCKKKGPYAIVYIYTMAIRVLFPSYQDGLEMPATPVVVPVVASTMRQTQQRANKKESSIMENWPLEVKVMSICTEITYRYVRDKRMAESDRKRTLIATIYIYIMA
jgi:hypothetical protein